MKELRTLFASIARGTMSTKNNSGGGDFGLKKEKEKK